MISCVGLFCTSRQVTSNENQEQLRQTMANEDAMNAAVFRKEDADVNDPVTEAHAKANTVNVKKIKVQGKFDLAREQVRKRLDDLGTYADRCSAKAARIKNQGGDQASTAGDIVAELDGLKAKAFDTYLKG